MKYHLLLSIFTLLIFSELLSQTQTCPQNQNHPDNHIITQTIGSETIVREYILKIPVDYDESKPTPLIINMHGFGDCAFDYAETIDDFYNFKALANEENIIVAYPQGAYRPEKEDTYWEPGDTGVDDIFQNDVYFIEQLIADIGAEYNLNSEMTFACGYSNGGMMAYSLGCNRSELFSAIGIMSGVMLDEDCTLDEPVPIIKFHGIADEVLPYNGNTWYRSVEEIVNFWLGLNEIPANSLSSSELNGGNAILDKYSGGNSNSCMNVYTINEEYDKPGDHVWFSEALEGITPNRIMWDFFKGNCGTISSTVESKEDEITLYPNPFNYHLEIKNADNLDYSLYDINGKLILNGKVDSISKTVNLSQLPSGFYTIKIGMQVKKLIKS